MRAFTRITTATVLAAGLAVVGVGAAQADPRDEVNQPVEGAAETVEGTTGAAGDLSPEAEALLQDPQVQELLANEDAVALLSDADSLKTLQALMELEDPAGALEALDLPVATDDLPVGTGDLPAGTDDVTGQLPADGLDTGGATQPVEDVVGGVGLP
ncbi:hypothetical protein [Nocardiopsis sp. NPDC006938]|uniref:hypothetical protein n=1 Tax=Nocardiopsis sp. NPDC006938 TaxID=3364337 RepID=UPI0036A915AB